MIDLKTVENIHGLLIDQFGGSKGIRDLNSLKAAIARPWSTFDQNDLYPFPIDKAAAIFESLIIGHPFLDGNKRISYVLMRLILLDGNLDINASQEDKYEFVMAASKGELRFEGIKQWLLSHIEEINEP
jgi:death on curing protein